MYAAGDEDAVRAEGDDGRGVVRCYCRRRRAVRPAADDANPPLDWLPRRAGKLHAHCMDNCVQLLCDVVLRNVRRILVRGSIPLAA